MYIRSNHTIRIVYYKIYVTSLTETRNVFEKKNNILFYNCNYTYYWRHL